MPQRKHLIFFRWIILRFFVLEIWLGMSARYIFFFILSLLYAQTWCFCHDFFYYINWKNSRNNPARSDKKYYVCFLVGLTCFDEWKTHTPTLPKKCMLSHLASLNKNTMKICLFRPGKYVICKTCAAQTNKKKPYKLWLVSHTQNW